MKNYVPTIPIASIVLSKRNWSCRWNRFYANDVTNNQSYNLELYSKEI